MRTGVKDFLKNTLTLTVTSVFINAVGIGFRSYISKKIGADGMGLYSLIMSVVFLASTFATSGLSLAVTRLVSENDGKSRTDTQILYTILSISIVIGTISGAALYLCADYIGRSWLRSDGGIKPIKWFSVSLPFLSVSTCMNGYFIAKGKIISCSKWQIAEQALKMSIVIIILNAMPYRTIETGCCAIAIGSVVGEIMSCGYGFLLYRGGIENSSGIKNKSDRNLYREIAAISAPTAAAAYFRAGLTTLENILIPQSFAKLRETENSALAEFGILKGMAMPVVNFPVVLLSSFASLLIPEISRCAAAKDNQKVTKICRISIICAAVSSICAAVFFGIFGEALGVMLFDNRASGRIISILALSVPFMYLDSVADAILKALDQQVSSMKYNALEGIIRIILIYTLIPIYGTTGFMIVIFTSNFTSAFLGMSKISKVLNKSFWHVEYKRKLKTVQILAK